jgi:polar amino acid transport system permease protein
MNYWIEVLSGLLSGMGLSLCLFGITAVASFPLAVILTIIGRKERPVASRILAGYTWLFRGTPLMMQLFFFMYGLPAVGISLPRFAVAVLAFVLNYAAYFVEILRAGIEAIDRDQTEAAAVMGAGIGATYRLVLLPQAIARQTPVIASELINLIKDTALVTVIALYDLMRQVREVVARDFTVAPFFLAAAFYLLISLLIVRISRLLLRERSEHPRPSLE